MRIAVLYFDGCPNHEPTVQRVREVLNHTQIVAPINEVEVTPDDDPAALKFLGSPTVLVDGVDIDPTQREGVTYGFGCRTFGGEGVPSVKMIEQALFADATKAGHPRGIAGWLTSLGAVPGIVASLLPVGLCPACWPAYAGVLSALGLGALLNSRYLLPITAMLLAFAVGVRAFRARQRRGYGPFALGVLASMIIIIGKFIFVANIVVYAGATLLVAASVWNAWPHKASTTEDNRHGRGCGCQT